MTLAGGLTSTSSCFILPIDWSSKQVSPQKITQIWVRVSDPGSFSTLTMTQGHWPWNRGFRIRYFQKVAKHLRTNLVQNDEDIVSTSFIGFTYMYLLVFQSLAFTFLLLRLVSAEFHIFCILKLPREVSEICADPLRNWDMGGVIPGSTGPTEMVQQPKFAINFFLLFH